MPDFQIIAEGLSGVVQFAGSMLAAVAILGGSAFAGAWALTRGAECNPYGFDACACGCGTDCEELPGG